MSRIVLFAAAALLISACSKTDDDTSAAELLPTLEPPADGEGFQLALETVAPALSEIWACEVYPLPTDGVASVNRVEYLQNEGTHHLTLSTFLTAGSIPHGTYDCDDLYGDTSLMDDQIMIFGTQGEPEGEMILPDGVAAQLPEGLDIIHEVHYVNTSSEDLTIYSYLNAYTVDDDEVEEGIWGGSVRDEYIVIPPEAEAHSEWTRCVMNEDVEVLFLASHTHELGIEFTIAPYDGETVGEVFFTNDDWHNPLITQYEPPIVVPAGEGFEFTCTWRNESDSEINYGPDSTDEMCNMAIVHTPFSVTALCEVVESSDGQIWSP